MDTTYLYSGTYASVLTSRLLSDAQRELLLATTTEAQVRTILEDTPLAPHLTTDTDVRSAAEAFLVAQVAFIRTLTPDPTVAAIMLLRHDYYNLKQIALGKRAGSSDDTILATCRPLGTIAPATLLERATKERLRFDEPRLGQLWRQLMDAPQFPHDAVDAALFAHLVSLAEAHPHPFLHEYVALSIDLHNLLMRLRVLTHPDSAALVVSGTFIPGGTMTSAGLASLDSVLDRLARFGGDAHWREAREAFMAAHDFSLLDRAADNYLLRFLKQASLEIHSPASLFAYYHAVTEHVQFVTAVVSAHAAGLSNDALRRLVRHSLLAYAY
jgi:vacuolar-type H+-ATPase subunit C/Vma6